jgi:hypothetical protein
MPVIHHLLQNQCLVLSPFLKLLLPLLMQSLLHLQMLKLNLLLKLILSLILVLNI